MFNWGCGFVGSFGIDEMLCVFMILLENLIEYVLIMYVVMLIGMLVVLVFKFYSLMSIDFVKFKYVYDLIELKMVFV